MPAELRVDTAALDNGGEGLKGAATDIPEPPAAFSAMGSDPLSTILNQRTQEIEAPIIAGMPATKADALRTAQNIIQAAGIYDRVDRELADQILKALFGLEGADAAGAPGAGAPGGGGGAPGAADAAGMAGAPAGAATAASAPAAAAPEAAAQQAGQMGQMMGMPMQMAQQAAQIPMQLAGMAAAIPQGIMQGVQSAMQQVGQMTSGAGDKADPEADRPGDGSPDEAKHAESAEMAPEEKTPSDGAAGPSTAERAPATGPQPTPAPEVPQQPHRPAPTRPATSGPESVL
jgi:hypothetical protein